MEFDYETLMNLADQFEKKAEQLLETADSIRETASIMSPKPPEAKPQTKQPPPAMPAEPEPQPAHEPPPPKDRFVPQPGYEPPKQKDQFIPQPGYEPPKTTPVVVKKDRYENKRLAETQPTFSPLEQHVLNSLENKIAGMSIDKITGYCKEHGMGTKGSVQFAVGKLVKAGHIARLQRGRYALPTAFNTSKKAMN